jgi:hypothetical protein
VAGQAEAPRMSSPLPVADDQVRHRLELRERLEQRGDLPEGQIPGTVGKRALPRTAATSTTSRLSASSTTTAA